MSVALGLLLLRTALALLLFGHAAQKLFGWFRGRGLQGTGAAFESSGLRPGALLALIAGLTELGAAALFLLGLATPLASAMAIGAMLVAIGSLWTKGLWGHLGGYEVALGYAIMAAVLALTGPGAYSLDALLPWGPLHGPGWALAAIVVAAIPAAPFIVRLARARRAEPEG